MDIIKELNIKCLSCLTGYMEWVQCYDSELALAMKTLFINQTVIAFDNLDNCTRNVLSFTSGDEEIDRFTKLNPTLSRKGNNCSPYVIKMQAFVKKT